MVLAADQAGGAWQAGPRYSPLLALDAGSSWAVPAEPPQAPGYAPLLPAEAGATWRGAQPYHALTAAAAGGQWLLADTGGEDFTPYVPLAADGAGASWQGSKPSQPLPASAAGAQFAHPKPAAPVYRPLAAASADASWLGAQPYAALQPGNADAQWVDPTPTEPTGHVATGFQATKFGTPERWIAPPATLVRAQGWQTGGFGTPNVPHQALPIMGGASFGTPQATFHTDIGGGGEPITVQARGWRSGSFGRPAAQAQLQVQAQGWQSAQFGQPVARQTVHAAAIASATAFGTPAAQLQLQAQARGWQAARFGTPLVQRQGNAQGFAVTKFGTPTAGAAFGAQAQGFQASTWGTPAMAVRVHALPIAPGTRFGRPTRTWSTEC